MAVTQDPTTKVVTVESLSWFYQQLCAVLINLFITLSNANNTFALKNGDGSVVFNASELKLHSGQNELKFSIARDESNFPILNITYNNGDPVIIPINANGRLALESSIESVKLLLQAQLEQETLARLNADEKKASIYNINVQRSSVFGGNPTTETHTETYTLLKYSANNNGNISYIDQCIPTVLTAFINTGQEEVAVVGGDVVYFTPNYINTNHIDNRSFGLYIATQTPNNPLSVTDSAYEYLGKPSRHTIYYCRNSETQGFYVMPSTSEGLSKISWNVGTVQMEGIDYPIAEPTDIDTIFSNYNSNEDNNDSNDNEEANTEE